MKKGYQVLALFCLLFGVQDSKSLLTDEIFPNVNDAIQTEVATAENRWGGLNQLKGLISGLVQKVAVLEQSKDTEIAKLNQRITVSHHLLCNFLHGNFRQGHPPRESEKGAYAVVRRGMQYTNATICLLFWTIVLQIYYSNSNDLPTFSLSLQISKPCILQIYYFINNLPTFYTLLYSRFTTATICLLF